MPADGASGLRELERRNFDLVLLDLMLPDTDGLDLFRALNASPSGADRCPSSC